MAEERSKSNDLVLVPGEYAYVRDGTKGTVEIFVGPINQPLSESHRIVIFDDKSKRFVDPPFSGKSSAATAPEGWYIVLKNPAKENKHPSTGSRATTPDLLVGQKVNIPGPDSFALWPGQMARVIQGHVLRSNQYLLVRVYNEQAATDSWSKAVIKPVLNSDGTEKPADAPILPTDLTMGKCLVIKGTEVAFYIPPTGIEVVWDGVSKNDKGQPVLVREAVTLESLEYCQLLDQNGNKRYEQGPAVVFPEPTEVFVEKEVLDADGKSTGESLRKFRAIELNEQSGIYVKVIAPYEEIGLKGTTVEHDEGEELFITGAQQRIYFPREEHAIIRYGDRDVHYAIAIPIGEAKYVLNRLTGDVRLVQGPAMFLPDPRKEVVVRRVLDLKTCQYLYPGNAEALKFNTDLLERMRPQATSVPTAGAGAASGDIGGSYSNASVMDMMEVSRGGGSQLIGSAFAAHSLAAPVGDTARDRGISRKAGRAFAGDAITRNQGYTEPRTITLDTKYRGAVSVTPWIGHAIMLVRKDGQKRVVLGPDTATLQYDEEPQIFSVSTGNPKNTDALLKDAYLRVRANKVSDTVYVETRDLVGLNIKLSYRVNFEGEDAARWFSIDNHVKLLCDHMRSKIRNAVMGFSIEEFYAKSVDILRLVILGNAAGSSDPLVEPQRPGTVFEENGMRIYDVEVLGLNFADAASQNVHKLLIESQRGAIEERIALEAAVRKLSYTERLEEVQRKTLDAKDLTKAHVAMQTMAESDRQQKIKLADILDQIQQAAETWRLNRANEASRSEVQLIMDERQHKTREMQISLQEHELALREADRKGETQAFIDKLTAVQPDLVAALQAFGDKEVLVHLTKSMAPLAILGGDSIGDIANKILAGSPIAKHLPISNGTEKRASQ